MAKTKIKIETEEQRLKRKAKEQKELAKREKELSRPRTKAYVWYLLMILATVQIIDEITTNITTQMQSAIAVELFQDRLSIMTALSALSLPLVALAVLYKTFSDRYGRKPFLVINTVGMSLGLFMVFLSGKLTGMSAIVIYVIASCIINFFIPNDTQVLYVMETAPADKRSRVFAIIKSVAMLGVMIIPLMRQTFMGDDTSRWNYVFLVPAIVAFVIAFVALLLAKESEVFLRNRIAYLKMTDKERAEKEKEKSKEANAQGGIGNAFRFAFSHKQLKWIFLSYIVFCIGAMSINYYEKIADTFYSTQEVTQLLMLYPVANALVTFVNGFFADKLGRKKTVVLMSALSFVSFTMFFIACKLHLNPYLAGFFVGCYTGSYWAAGDVMGGIMVSESSPTNLRASLLSAHTMLSVLGKMLAMLVPLIVLLVTKDNYNILGTLCICATAPALFIALMLFTKNVGDTTGIDLNTVRGDEWDK